MKIIKDKIVYIDYPGEFSQRDNIFLFQELTLLKEPIRSRNIEGIYINIKDTSIPENKLNDFIDSLQEISNKINCMISLGEYPSYTYESLRDATKKSSIKLFKTKAIAMLFFNPKLYSKKLKVLLFDDGDEFEIDKQSSYLTRYGHDIIYTKDKKEFEETLTQGLADFSINQTKLNKDFQGLQNQKTSFTLNKNTILNLQTFIDTAVDNIDTLTSMKSKKVSHSVSEFKTDIGNDIVSSIMKFKGDLSGSFVLIFPNKLAQEAVEKMLDDDSEDLISIRDGIGEFCNIITGNTKTKFQKKDIKVLFELPKTYTSIEATKKDLPNSKGIWIDMEIEKNPFYIYIAS